MNWDAVSTIVTAIGVLVAGIAVYMSAWVAMRLHREQVRHSRRQDLIPIWKEMLEISRIKSQDPNPEDVRIALNLLALVAQCAELRIVEVSILREMFGKVYIDVYNDIAAVNKDVTIGNTTKPGRDFLTDLPRVTQWHREWSASR